MIGELLGRFRLLADVATLGGATLYHARDEVSGEPARVVALVPDAIRTRGELRAFQRRVQVLRGLNSPHAPTPVSAGMLEGTWFIACAGAPGVPLDEVSRRLGPLDVPDAVALGAQLFRALGQLHARGALLQQVLPSSALLGADGCLSVWNVVGPGAAKAAGKTLALTRMDFASMIYSPSADAAGATRARDVYGAGMVLAHLLAGGSPARPKSLPELLSFVQNPRFALPTPLDPRLEQVLLSAVAPQAAKRPPARRLYGQLLEVSGMKARHLEKRARHVVARLAEEPIALPTAV